MGMNGRKGRARELARIRKRRLDEAKAAGIDVADRAAVKAFYDAKWDDLVMRYAKPWRDRQHPSYHGEKTEHCLGCGEQCAKSAWGRWCYTCNVTRMTRINDALEPVAKALGVER